MTYDNIFMKMIKMLFLLFPIIALCQTKAKVVGVKDGDTIEVLLEGNTTKVLRLAEVDCPENSQAFGKNAKQFTSSQVFGKQITYVETNKDRWGRVVAQVYYSGGKKYLSEEIIKAGFGWWYFQYSKNKQLGVFQKKAKADKVGLWQDKHAISPWEFRKLKKEQSKQKNKKDKAL